MRWYALRVDYEMSGKDLIDSVKLSSRICRVLGGQPPESMTYELFLDQDGQKISKSKGNGLSVEDWLTYAPAGIAGAVHVQPAAARQAAVFRRHPARGRRICRQPGQAAGAAGAGQSGLAHPCRPPAEPCRQPDLLRHAAQPRQRGERRHAGHPVGLHPALRPGRQPGNAAAARPPRRPRRRLLPRLRPAEKHYRAARRDGARRAGGPRRDAGRAAGQHRRDDPERGVRGRQAPPVPRSAQLVRLPVPGAAGPAGRSALRRLRRAVRHPGDDRADPVGARPARADAA